MANCGDSLHKQSETVKSSAKIEEGTTPSVVIVGAGLSGLAAGEVLKAHHLNNFKMLEATDRVGGRIWSSSLGGRVIELGANWIHGMLSNPIFERAFELGLVDLPRSNRYCNVMACTDQGNYVPISIVDEVKQHYYESFNAACDIYTLQVPVIEPTSVGAFLKQQFRKWVSQFPNEDQQLIRLMVFEQMLKREASIDGVHDLDELDLAEIGAYAELPGGNIRIKDGFSNIIENIYQTLPKDCLMLEHPVRCIHWDCGDKVRVECSNGKVFLCDHVICTVSIGYLQHHHVSLFDPILPEEKLAAFSRIGFGNVNKIFIEFEKPMDFLDLSLNEILLLWEPNGTEEEEDEEINKNNWFRKIYSFKVQFDNVLCGWLAGKQATFMQSLTDKEVLDTVWMMLKQFLNNPSIPRPISLKRTNWGEMPYIRGAYSSLKPGGKTSDFETVAAPLYSSTDNSRPLVLFAGEHCHPNYYSTAHGALLTGRHEAERIVTLLQKSEHTPKPCACVSEGAGAQSIQYHPDSDSE